MGLSLQKGYHGETEAISQAENLNKAFPNGHSPVEVGEGKQIRYEPCEKTDQGSKRFQLTYGVRDPPESNSCCGETLSFRLV